MNHRAIALIIAAAGLTGCTLGPNYHRPDVQIPQNFRAPSPLPAPEVESFGDLKWWEVFKDPDLQQLVKTAIQTAFTEVSNALIAHQRVRESRVEQVALVRALEDRKRLAYARYNGGVDTQLNALDADRDLLQAQLDLRQIRLNELLSVVQLYKALGGGWT